MTSKNTLPVKFAVALLAASAAGCGSDEKTDVQEHEHEQALLVAHEGTLNCYTFEGEEHPGAVQLVSGPVDMQVLEDATALVNLTGRNEILALDGLTMLEKARIPSSAIGATRPVHSLITPEHGGRRYWLTMNDGEEGLLETNSALFVDIDPASPSYLTSLGEVALGIGHHKASFSATRERVVISNIADCDNVLTVYDYSDLGNITALETLTSSEAGWDGSSFETTCDQTYQNGIPPAPHGCATSKLSGKAYCNVTGSGDIIAIDIDADPPTFTPIGTTGSGGGYTKTSSDGRYVYTLQEEPRAGSEFNPGPACQIGQLVVIDASTDALVAEVPLSYKGPGCTDDLAGTDEETAGPSHIQFTPDGQKMFITLAGGFGLADARVRQELVVDLSDPASPTQLASIAVGASVSHHGDALTGDGRFLFIANNSDASVTQIDTSTLEVVRTLSVANEPSTIATFGEHEGPSVQTGPIH